MQLIGIGEALLLLPTPDSVLVEDSYDLYLLLYIALKKPSERRRHASGFELCELQAGIHGPYERGPTILLNCSADLGINAKSQFDRMRRLRTTIHLQQLDLN